ncbi:hypothetical protein [Leptospira sp. GIMC2001]|uniref:hypothetical protein n=1 Tax=Leptospira sp. GIMC2001 TaxID=1513297 RepID=UPI00234B267C|nr:hypothetical protein [Leptospira sp. GIMC2001]WCL50498.1 hypothetical protein O4O04_06670 [Leptospira sp. GIMC2001]
MKNLPVPAVTAVELARLIRLLAMTGKKAFHKYLYQPISYASWEGPKQSWTSRKYMERIREEHKDISRLNGIAPHCKKMICQAMTENPTALGDSCLLFLDMMQAEPIVASSVESIDFVKIIEKPLKEFRDIHSNRSEKLFEESVENFSPEELKEVFKPIRLDAHQEKVKLESEVHLLYQQILAASKSGNLQRCKKLLSSYIIKYRDQDSYSEDEVDKLCQALEKREAGFIEELRNSMAIEIYYQLTKSILEKNLKRSIIQIRKYAHIFEGDPSTPYFLEIDKMERTLYKIISDKGLMDELKKSV